MRERKHGKDNAWLQQLGSLEGHSCVLLLLYWAIFRPAHPMWSDGG